MITIGFYIGKFPFRNDGEERTFLFLQCFLINDSVLTFYERKIK